MPNIFVCYPKLFKCYSKFERKVHNIISSLESPKIIYFEDVAGLIAELSKSHSYPLEKLDSWSFSLDQVTHAIIFDDGNEFPEITQKIIESNIPLRKIKILITRVINIRNETEFSRLKSTPQYEYIGRGSYWGNPYSMFEDGDDREEVIRKFKYDFEFDKFPNKSKSEVYKLAGKRLGCFCHPKMCHGDILADFLNSWDDGK